MNDSRRVGRGQPDSDVGSVAVPLESGAILAAVAVEIADYGAVEGSGRTRREQETDARNCEDTATRAPGAH